MKGMDIEYYYRTVRMYATARGLPCFTCEQLQIVIRLYNAHAEINN